MQGLEFIEVDRQIIDQVPECTRECVGELLGSQWCLRIYGNPEAVAPSFVSDSKLFGGSLLRKTLNDALDSSLRFDCWVGWYGKLYLSPVFARVIFTKFDVWHIQPFV